MEEITTEKELYSTIAYHPGPNDADWKKLKWAVQKQIGKEQDDLTIKDIAKFLIKNPDFNKENEGVNIIRKLYLCFKIKYFNKSSDNGVEASPRKDGKGIYLRGGNKSTIAYAMKLLKNELGFKRVKIWDWRSTYTREDTRNLQHLSTLKGKIICR